jgi:hypothetical protein
MHFASFSRVFQAFLTHFLLENCQAANIMEALEVGATVLLVDEVR